MNLEPIFIVGAPRSGTTLLSAMISSHSQISCGPETQFFNKLSPQKLDQAVKDKTWPTMAVELVLSLTLSGQKVFELFNVNPQEIEDFLKDQQPSISAMLESLTLLHAKKENKSRWAEKTPNHLLHLQQIRELFPKSPIIRIIRDPRDSANSMTKLPWASDLPLTNAYLWNDWYQSSKTFFSIDQNTLTIRYEDLVQSPNEVLKSITDFIGETFEESMLDTSRSGKTVSSENETWKSDVSKPLDVGKLYQWKKVLPSEIVNTMSFACLDAILSFNYELNKMPAKFFQTFPLTKKFIENNITEITYISNEGIALVDETNPFKCQRLLLLTNNKPLANWTDIKINIKLILIIYMRKIHRLETYYIDNYKINKILKQVLKKYCKRII